MTQLLVTPQTNYPWTKALQSRGELSETDTLDTFRLVKHKALLNRHSDNIAQSVMSGCLRVSKAAKHAIRVLSANLLHATKRTKLTGVCHSLTKRKKAAPKRFNQIPYSNDVMTKYIREMEEKGLLRLEKGFKGEHHATGLSTLILPTARFSEYADSATPSSLSDISLDTDPLILRDNNRDYIDYTDTTDTTLLRQNLYEQNDLRQSFEWNFRNASGDQIRLSRADLTCRRIFKSDWVSGGRFYCHAQNLSKAERSTITVIGESFVELDFKSLHPRLMYNFKGLDAPEDCYDIDGLTREQTKHAVLVATSTKSRTQAIKAIAYHQGMTPKEAEETLDSFERKHSSIADMLYASSWSWLQHTDSVIANGILNVLRKDSVPVLPVHDSFVVPVSQKDRLKSAMETLYEQHTGMLPIIA